MSEPRFIFTRKDDPSGNRALLRLEKKGELLRVANGIYTRPTQEPMADIVRRGWHELVAHFVPDGVVTDRTGFDIYPVPGDDGTSHIFLSAPRARSTTRIENLIIHIRQSAGPVEGDIPMMGTWSAGPARRYLDNLAPSRARQGPARTLGRDEIERRLDLMCATQGADAVNSLRDEARRIAPLIDRKEEFTLLDGLIGTMLRTRQMKLRTKRAQARSEGVPFDANCLGKLERLADFLRNRAPHAIVDPNAAPGRRRSSTFMEAYFSNYIEGTRFLVGEAVNIVFEGRIPVNRPQDGHDVLNGYEQLMALGGRSIREASFEDFIEEIQGYHRELMRQRPEIAPGRFKAKANQAGETTFVAPDLVHGTLHQGFPILKGMDDPFARAVATHFLIAEVHPFEDGNGRLSRLMMTKELTTSGLSHIVVPTVFRSDYLDALRALSRRGDPEILVRSMEFCQRVSAACSAETVDAAIENWARSYGFCEDQKHARLTMPDPTLEVSAREGIPAPTSYWAAVDYDKKHGGALDLS